MGDHMPRYLPVRTRPCLSLMHVDVHGDTALGERDLDDNLAMLWENIMRRRRDDMLRSFGIGGTWTSAGFRAPGMWAMWEDGTTVGFAQRGASLPAPRGCETLWQAVLDDESTPRVLAEIGRIDGGLSAQDHKYEARWG